VSHDTIEAILKAVVGHQVTARAVVQIPEPLEEVEHVVVTWILQDPDGVEYARGFAPHVEVMTRRTTATAYFSLPDNLEADDYGTEYQVKWIFDFDGEEDLHYFESFLVYPPVTDPFGPMDAVEIYGMGSAELICILPIGGRIPTASVTVFNEDNVSLYSKQVIRSSAGDNGKYRFVDAVDLVTNKLVPSLVPYSVIWNYRVDRVPQQELGRLFVTTPSILQAQKELGDWINRLHTDTGLEEAQYTMVDMMSFLKSGADYFNTLDQVTTFSMTRAKGPIAHFWITAAKAVALRSQYLAEGEKSFDFGGQAISLSTDVTGYLESQLSNAESYLQENAERFKRQARKKGIIGGDGSENAGANASRVGVCGVQMSLVSQAGRAVGR